MIATSNYRPQRPCDIQSHNMETSPKNEASAPDIQTNWYVKAKSFIDKRVYQEWQKDGKKKIISKSEKKEEKKKKSTEMTHTPTFASAGMCFATPTFHCFLLSYISLKVR